MITERQSKTPYLVALVLTVTAAIIPRPTSALLGAVWMTFCIVTFASWFYAVAFDWLATHDAETRREDQALWADQPVPEDWS